MNQAILRENLKWGTFGKNPTSYDIEDVQWVFIKDLSDTHIVAIIKTQSQIPDWYKNSLVEELLFRIKNHISIPEVEKYYVQ